MDIFTNQFIFSAISSISILGVTKLKNILTSYAGFRALRILYAYGPRIIFRKRLMSVVILIFVYLIMRELTDITLRKLARKLYNVLIHTPAKKLFNLLRRLVMAFWRRIKELRLLKRKRKSRSFSQKKQDITHNLPPYDPNHPYIYEKWRSFE